MAIIGIEQALSRIHETVFDPNVPLPGDRNVWFRFLASITIHI